MTLATKGNSNETSGAREFPQLGLMGSASRSLEYRNIYFAIVPICGPGLPRLELFPKGGERVERLRINVQMCKCA